MLKKSGVLKTSKTYLNKTSDNKQVGFSTQVNQLDYKPKKTVNIGHNKTFNKQPLKEKPNMKQKKTFKRSFTGQEEINEVEEKEMDSIEENEVLDIDFSQNEQLNDYYNILKKSPYENWCLSLNKFTIFSFLMGHTDYHNNKFSDYCAICSTKCDMIEQAIICYNCFNAVLLFELVLNKMDNDCIDEFLNGKNLYKAQLIKNKQKNYLRNFIYEEYGFLTNNFVKNKNENKDDKKKVKFSRHKTDPQYLKSYVFEDNKDEDNENIIIEENNDEEINTSIKENEEINVLKNGRSEDITNSKKVLDKYNSDKSENNSIININVNNTQNNSRYDLVIKVIQRCFECKTVRENAYFRYDKEKNIYKCFNCTISQVQKLFMEGNFYQTVAKKVLTNLTFHKETNLF